MRMQENTTTHFENGRTKAQTIINQKMQNAGLKVGVELENAYVSPKKVHSGKFYDVYELSGSGYIKYELRKGGHSAGGGFHDLSDAKEAADTEFIK